MRAENRFAPFLTAHWPVGASPVHGSSKIDRRSLPGSDALNFDQRSI
jgi:hypothetical protein